MGDKIKKPIRTSLDDVDISSLCLDADGKNVRNMKNGSSMLGMFSGEAQGEM